MSFLSRFNPFARAADADAAVETKANEGWSVAFPNSAAYAAFGAYGNDAGVPVTPLTALQNATGYACVRLLSEDVAKLPLRIRRAQNASGRTAWVEESGHRLNALLRRPNRWQTPYEFWSQMVVAHQSVGNGYAIIRREGGWPAELIPVRPEVTSVLLHESGNVFYETQHRIFGDARKRFNADDILHIRNISFDGGYNGLSPLACGQEVIGLALATQGHAARFFSQGTTLSGTLTTDNTVSPEAGARMKASWEAANSGAHNAHKVALLEEGVKFEANSSTAADAQLNESRVLNAEEICRIFRVPPHKVGLLDKATFSNIEQQEQSYVSDALMGICRRIEEACDRDLLPEEEQGQLCFKFDFSEMLRGDTTARFNAYQIALTNGVLSRNEVRARENLPPVEGGDEYRVPVNTADPLKAPTDAIAPNGGKNNAADHPETQPA